MHKYSKEEIISEAKFADKKSDEPLTLKDFVRMSGIKEWQIKIFFPKGGWSELKRLANIKDEPRPSIKLSRKKFAFTGKAINKKKPNLTKEYVIAEEDIIVEEDIVAEEVAEEKADAKKAAKKDADAIKAAAEKAAKKDADAIKETAEKAAKKDADAIKAAAEKAAKEDADAIKAAAEKAAKEDADAIKAAAEKAAKEDADAIKATAEKAAKEDADAIKAATEKASKKDADAIKATAEKAAKKDADAIKAAAEKAAKKDADAIKAAAEKAAKKKIVEPPISPSKQSQKGITDTINDDIAEFGEIIDFRGLRHAPINQNGVIFLFGMVSNELGFMVEAIHAAFPECEAKRHVGENRYQRVRIKFEYKSSNYMSHGYDLSGADMIVCWVHDWHDCPLEVLELQIAIDKLES